MLCFSFPPPRSRSPKDHYETMLQHLPKCESLWEVTKTGSEGSLGAALNENLKIAGFVVGRNTHLIRKCLWHVFVRWLGYSRTPLAGNYTNSMEEVKKTHPGEENMPEFHFLNSILFYFLRFLSFRG